MARTSAKLRWHAWLAAACALWLCVISLAVTAGAPARGAGFTGNERPALSAMPELLADAGEAHRRRRDHDAAVAIVHPCAPTPPVACRAATGLADIRILFRSAVASAPPCPTTRPDTRLPAHAHLRASRGRAPPAR